MRPRALAGWLVAAVLVLGLVAAGGATAGALITGAQIKNGSVASKDIKDRSLKLKDLKPGEVAKLKGKDGTNGKDGAPGAPGADGADGLGPMDVPASGTVIIGGGLVSADTSPAAGTPVTGYIALPFRTAQPLDDDGAGRNLWAKPSSSFATAHESATNCPGTAQDPTSLPGMLCVYGLEGAGGQTDLAVLISGSTDNADPTDEHGFLIRIFANGAATPRMHVMWVYTAP